MRLNSAEDLDVYQKAYKLAMRVFELSRAFPVEEKFALTIQICRSSRSVCLNLREAWAKRRSEAHFVGKLTDCDGENSETESSLDFARWLHDSRTGIGHHLKGGRQDDWRHDHQPAPFLTSDLRADLFLQAWQALPYMAVTLWLAALLRVRALG